MLPEFLNLQFKNPNLWAHIERVSTGTTASRNRWKEAQFNAFAISLPPLAEQRRIVDVMASVEAQIEALEEEVQKHRAAVGRARMALVVHGIRDGWHTAVTDSQSSLSWTAEVPPGWRAETIGAVATIRSGATPRRSDHDRYFVGGSIPWVKTGDLNEAVILETDELITDTAMAETSVRLLPADTVLVAMYGGFGQIGRTARLGLPAATNQALSALTELREDVHPAYLHEVLKAGRPKWRLVAASSRKDPNISKKDIEVFDFPLPPLEVQSVIVEVLSEMNHSVSELSTELSRLRQFRSVLLTSLLNQDIEIPDSYDRLLEDAV